MKKIEYLFAALLLVAGICFVTFNVPVKIVSAGGVVWDKIEGELPEPVKVVRSRKVDPLLSLIAEGYTDNPESPVRISKTLESYVRDGMVDVVIKSDLPTVLSGVGKPDLQNSLNRINSEVQRVVESVGGEVNSVIGDSIYARIAPETSHTIAAVDSISSIRLEDKPVTHEVSEGLPPMGVDALRALLPYRTQKKVKICVLDIGFYGYKDLLGKELPQKVVAKSFWYTGDMEATQHGTGCAEIIHDILPEAEIYLAAFDSAKDFKKAVDWIVENDIDVVSFSIGFLNAGPGNGVNIYSDIIKLATSKGITWVTSAGNDADDHWSGTFSDPDGNGWHNFEDGSEILQVVTDKKTFSKGYMVRVFLKWDEWGTYSEDSHSYSGTDQDYDLYLYYEEDGKWKPFSVSRNFVQDGNDMPVERGIPFMFTETTRWGIRIKKVNASRNAKLDILVLKHPGPLQFTTPEGSVGCPGTSDHVVTVGAVGWQDDELHYYSSQGPTADGRIKPDITSYAGNSTISYGKEAFYGTSAACPHAAGAIGLIMSKTGVSGKEAFEILKARALDKGDKGVDNKYGYGVLKLSVK